MDHAPTGILRETFPFPKTVTHLFINHANPTTVDVPAGAKWVKPSVTAVCYWKTGGAAAVPVADVVDGTGVAVLYPGDVPPVFVGAITSFSIIADPDYQAGAPGGITYASFSWYGG